MNILLSVYACNPFKGSEPGIGWNWVVTLNKLGYKLTVLTRLKNKKYIDQAIQENKQLETVKFVYYDLPKLILKFKKYIGVYAYYEFWQLGAYYHVKNRLKYSEFDLVHHLTFGVIRHPSYLYKLGCPFIMGPLGGGEYAPKELLVNLPIRYRSKEKLRALANFISLQRFSVNKCYQHARLIFTRTGETYNAIPKSFQHKTKILIDIGVDSTETKTKVYEKSKTFTVLFLGRLVYWKGLLVALESFKKFNRIYPDSILNIVGEGEYYDDLVTHIKRLNLVDCVNVKGSIPHDQVEIEYRNADAFLFPSLHDAGPLVIFESLTYGLPIVAINLGGVGQLLGAEYPTLVSLGQYELDLTTTLLADKLFQLATDSHFYDFASISGLEIVKTNTWQNTVASLYDYTFKNIQ